MRNRPLTRASDPLGAIPRAAGVYFLYDGAGDLLYIGKAKRLRDRLRSYTRVDPRTAPENVAEFAPRIREVRWQVCSSERAALKREAELLLAIRPPFNLAGVERQNYLFIVLRVEEGKEPAEARLRFHLTEEPELDEGEKVFGCYQARQRVKAGYTALFRLMYATRCDGRRFYSYPAKISRDSPPWIHSTVFPREWLPQLESFLDGRSIALLRLITDRLLENESVPRFLYPSLQEDIRIVREFYDRGPRASRRLKLRHAVRAPVLSQAMMDSLSVRGVSIGEFSGGSSWV